MKKITPLLTVDDVEACLGFWTALGFELAGTVPHEDTVGFAMLVHGDLMLMYQSAASVEADLEASGAPEGLAREMGASTSTLFIEVEDLDAALNVTGAAEVLVPRRQTFYGMDEVFLRAPCGTVVGLAQRVEGAGAED